MKNGFCDCLAERVDKALNFVVDDGIATGCALMIGKGGELVHEAFAGYEDFAKTRPVTKDTVYRMYSMTKLVTVVCVMQLWEQGAFSLSDRLSRYIPEYEHMTVLQPDGTVKDAKNPIRIKNLLTMTAGFDYSDAEVGGDYYEKFAAEWAAAKAAGNKWDTVTAVKKFAKVPLLFEPGTGYAYSFAFDVLGALVEIWSGETLAEYAKNHIFKPLGMENTGFSYDDINVSRLAEFGGDHGNGLEPANGIDVPLIDVSTDYDKPAFFSGGAGMLSTIGDYFKFARMLALCGTADGVKYLSPRTVKFLHSDQLTDRQKADFARWNGYDTCSFTDVNTYGLGTRILVKPHRDMYASIGEWGWSGALGTWVSIDPEEDMFYVYAHQRTPSDNDLYLPRIAAAIYSSME